MLNVKIISKELIKPSSPTPNHLVNYELSRLDHIAPPAHIPMIFFYNAKQSTESNFTRANVSQRLKKSLSDTLVLFYPLAGMMKTPYSVSCNDRGAEFNEIEVRVSLSQVIENPNMEELVQFLPMDPCSGNNTESLLAIQITYFDCGGIAIGICMYHKIADGSSLVMFMNSWAANSIGANNIMRPYFGSTKHFPAREASSEHEMPITGTKEEFVTKIFVFDKKLLTAMKTASASRSQVKNPTRVEVITTFIWKVFLKEANAKSKKISVIGHAVDLRPKKGENNFFGNLWTPSMAIINVANYFDDYDIVVEIRKSIKGIDKDTMKNLANGEGAQDMGPEEDIEFYKFSSWVRFPVYETDFGWGRPIWVCTTRVPVNNLVVLMSTKCGEGIEAWINLCAEDMVILEKAYKSLSFSFPN